MAQHRLAMDSLFWDSGVSTPFVLDATAKAIPGEPSPLNSARAGLAERAPQVLILRRGFPLGLVPSFFAPPKPEVGPYAVQTFIGGPSGRNWWTGIIPQFRPAQLVSDIKSSIEAEYKVNDEVDWVFTKDVARHIARHAAKYFRDKSLFALGFFSQFAFRTNNSNTSISFNLEGNAEREDHRGRAALVHNFLQHVITLEAAWPELFLDSKGTYWSLPRSLSLNAISGVSKHGLRFRLGLQKNDGQPLALNSATTNVPSALLPGLCVKAAVSYENSRDFWRVKNEISNMKRENLYPPYDDKLKEPHSAISGIIGGFCSKWVGENGGLPSKSGAAQSGESETQSGADSFNSSIRKRNPFSADLFGSLYLTYQRGKFTKNFNDLTRLDACISIPSAASFIKGASCIVSDIFGNKVRREVDQLSSPRFSVILQQQIAGPIVVRLDSRFSFNSPNGGHRPYVEDILYCLSYSLWALQSGKVLAWYSPKRKEAMVEIRLFEF